MTDTNHQPLVVFALRDVAFRWLPDERIDALAALVTMAPGLVDQLVIQSGFNDAAERGAFTLDEFTEQLCALLGLPHTAENTEAIQAAWARSYAPIPAIARLARSEAYRSAVMGNGGPLCETAVDSDKTWDATLLSWRIGTTFDGPEAYEKAAATFATTAQSILYFDADQEALNHALSAGWNAHLFTTALNAQLVIRSEVLS